MVGLGRMGSAVAWRLIKGGHEVFGFDQDKNSAALVKEYGVCCMGTLPELVKHVHVIWMMVPAGKPVDDVIETLLLHATKNQIIIDGGNSYFADSIRRYTILQQKGISFLDCGTSGGVHGKELGFSLMIGGDQAAYKNAEVAFKAIAATGGYAYFGPAGAGHYIKMVHNGIEYALLQAYAEGFQLLKEGKYSDLDLEKICTVWNNGSIVRSWLVNLSQQVFQKDQKLEAVSGEIGENQTGKWMVAEAHERKVPVKVIEQALDVRAWSRQTGGNFATKVVALLRNVFGGHAVKKI